VYSNGWVSSEKYTGESVRIIPSQKKISVYYYTFIVLSLGLYIFFSLYGFNRTFSLGYDAGVYTQTAFQHAHGQRLYSELFVSQPPLLIETLSVVIRIFGINVAATRVVPVVFGLIALFGSFLISRELFGRSAAYLTVIFLGITFYFIRWTFEIGSDLPSLSFSLLALYFAIRYSKKSSVKWIVLSALFFAVANAFKQLELFFVFPICFLLIFRLEPEINTLRFHRNGSLGRILQAVGVYIAVFAAVLGLILLNYDVQALVSQVIGLQSEDLFRLKLNRLGRYFGNVFIAGQLGLFFLTLASLYHFFRTRRQVFFFLLLLIFSQVVFHALMSSWLWGHHLIVLIAVFTIVYAGGVDEFIRKINRLRAERKERRGLATKQKLLVVLFIVALVGVCAQNFYLNIKDIRRLKRGPSEEEKRLLHIIETHTTERDLIICDYQIALFRSNRFTTPALVDTSEKRIFTKDLDDTFLIGQAQDVKMVIFWLHRLKHAPRFVQYVQENFILLYKNGEKEVYLRQ
jgi:hypothetical protein